MRRIDRLIGRLRIGPIKIIQDVHGESLLRQKRGGFVHPLHIATGAMKRDDRGHGIAVVVGKECIEANGLASAVESELGLRD